MSLFLCKKVSNDELELVESVQLTPKWIIWHLHTVNCNSISSRFQDSLDYLQAHSTGCSSNCTLLSQDLTGASNVELGMMNNNIVHVPIILLSLSANSSGVLISLRALSPEALNIEPMLVIGEEAVNLNF